MRFGEPARIIYGSARDALHGFHAYRAMLDYYTMDTSAVRVNVEAKLRQALLDESPAPAADRIGAPRPAAFPARFYPPPYPPKSEKSEVILIKSVAQRPPRPATTAVEK